MMTSLRLKSAILMLLALPLAACDNWTDPYDRIQGEPSEDGAPLSTYHEFRVDSGEIAAYEARGGDSEGSEKSGQDEGH